MGRGASCDGEEVPVARRGPKFVLVVLTGRQRGELEPLIADAGSPD